MNAESCEVILTFEPVEKPFRVISQMKSFCQYVHMVLFVFQRFTSKRNLKVLSNFESSVASGRDRFSETGRQRIKFTAL